MDSERQANIEREYWKARTAKVEAKVAELENSHKMQLQVFIGERDEAEDKLRKVSRLIEFHPSDILPTKLRDLLKEDE